MARTTLATKTRKPIQQVRRLRPSPHASLMVPLRCTDKQALVFTPTRPQNIHVCWLDSREEGKVLACTTIRLKAGITYYFFASPLTLPKQPGYRYYYLLQHSETRGRAACSCSTGWAYPKTQVACEHMQQLSKAITPATGTSEADLALSAHEGGKQDGVSSKEARGNPAQGSP